MDSHSKTFPWAFFWRRAHSFAGFGLTLFVFFHLLTNSQAAFWIGDDGRSYIHSVNGLNAIPYLEVVEILFLALPLFIHAIWGIYYIQTSKSNAYEDTGKDPYLPQYGRNRAYTWQRITSWILLFGIVLHVGHMRFIERPLRHESNDTIFYTVMLDKDKGLNSFAKRVHVDLKEMGGNQVIATAKDFGTAELLMVRNTFKSPLMMGLYTVFVLAAGFHAFNGLWTFLITWGMPLSVASQMFFLRVATSLMFLVTFLGLATIYLTYWVNLRY